MPTLGAPLDLAKYEAKNFRAHQLGTAPASPVTGQLYYNTADNTLYWWDGGAWNSAKGVVPDATATVKGLVQLAGDLTGTAAAPVVANGAITSAKIADATITDVDVALANKNGAPANYAMRTIDATPGSAMPGAPSAPVSFQNQRITSLADPTASGDAANKNYVDNTVQGLDAKQSVRCASTANLGLTGLAAIDGITPIAGDRVLAKDQTTASANGIYIAAAGAWARATDTDAWNEFPGAFTWVEQGTAQADTGWICTVDTGGTLGTTAITWTQFSGAALITAGAGIAKAGNTLSANPDGVTLDTAGAGSSLEVKALGISTAQLANNSIDLTGTKVFNALPIAKGGTGAGNAASARIGLNVPVYYSAQGPPSTGTTWVITRATWGGSGGTPHVQVSDASSGNVELPDINIDFNGVVTITWGAAVTATSKNVAIIGL